MGILMVALPLAIQSGVYLKLKHDLQVLHKETAELSVRRDIVTRINDMLVMSFFGFQSLMQLKMYGDDNERKSFVGYTKNMLVAADGLADVLEKKGGDAKTAHRVKFLVRQFLEWMQKSQFSPDENNQIATIFEGMQVNVKFRDAARNLFWELQEIGRAQEKMVVEASTREESLRAEFERISDITVIADIVVALLLAGYFVRNTIGRLNILKENTRRLGSGIHLLEPLDSGDEIGELDRTFHGMVDTLNTLRQREKKMSAWLEESKERLELVIRNVPAALIVVDKTGLVESLNPTAEALFEYKSGACSGKPLQKLFIKDPRLSGHFIDNLLELSVDRPIALEAISSSQEMIAVEVSATSFEGPDGEQVLATIIDVTERYRLEQIKRDFYSMVSHDIRTPLTTISGILQLSRLGKYGAISGQLSSKLNTAEDNTHRLLEMVGRLLDLDKLDQGAIDVSREMTPVEAIVSDSFKSVLKPAEDKDVRLEFVGEKMITVFADRHYMVQVLTNLLANAIKFSPRGGSVQVSCRPVVQARMPQNLVEICVRDDGPGVPESKRAAIFERFKQADAKRDSSTGFGLGLTICKQIVDLHGGAIGVRSGGGETPERESGSEFWFTVQAG
jgi:PAS domain S-box-containing protein